MILSHHLLNPFRSGGKTKDGGNFLLQLESEIVLSSSAQEVKLVSDGPEQLEALV